MAYDLLHEASTPDEEVANKYDVHTFEEYKINPSVTNGYTPFQSLVFTLVYAMHVGGNKPRCLIINRDMALDLMEQQGKIPEYIEDVPLAFDEKMIFKLAWLV